MRNREGERGDLWQPGLFHRFGHLLAGAGAVHREAAAGREDAALASAALAYKDAALASAALAYVPFDLTRGLIRLYKAV